MYPIEVRTESGRHRSRPTPLEFRELLSTLGYSGDQWLIAESMPAEPDTFFQVLRESDTCYRTEIRDGDASRHVAAVVDSVEDVDRVMADWAHGDRSWQMAHSWMPFELLNSDIEPHAETNAEATAMAHTLVAGGYLTKYRAAQALVDTFSESGGRLRLVHNQAMRIIVAAWKAREAEQATWPERTDPDRLAEAFAAVEAHGIVARADFTCCGSCGHAEIANEMGPESLGYVFFHHQSTDAVVAQGRLWLQYGASGPQRDQDAVIGHRIVDALTGAGLPVEWNGDGRSAIVVGPIIWQKRLPATAR
jgi:hypothetical protein